MWKLGKRTEHLQLRYRQPSRTRCVTSLWRGVYRLELEEQTPMLYARPESWLRLGDPPRNSGTRRAPHKGYDEQSLNSLYRRGIDVLSLDNP